MWTDGLGLGAHNNWRNEITLNNHKMLTGSRQRKAGIISINRFSGIDAVCLYALCDLGVAIEHSDVLELGDFLNGYMTNARSAGAECCSDLSDSFLVHDETPIEWYLGNISRYVQENEISAAELTMMIDVAIRCTCAIFIISRW